MSEEKTKSAKREKPAYNLWQNSAYMIGLAWKKRKSVIWLCLILAAFAVASNLIGLFIAPTVLAQVQEKAPLQTLLVTIAGFAAALLAVGAANSYAAANTLYGRVEIRIGLVSAIHEKFAKTSYPNTEDQKLQKKLDKACMAVFSNNQASEAIWGTLTDLLKSIAGFCVYLALLSSVNLLIVAVTLATTVTGYFISKRINGWGYRHREEEAEYSRRMNYVSSKAEDYTIAKDIRIFGMRDWLEDVYEKTLRLYQTFVSRGEKVYFWADVVDVLFSFLRNGIAYAILIGLTLRDGLSAPQFLLYFSAVGGFTSWVGGILSGFSTLHIQSLDLSTVREFLETPEPFRFEDGNPLEPDPEGRYEITLRNLTFRYPGAENDTLRKINLTIRPGEKLAVVGLNGAGKTTLIRLICGFYDPTEGEVLLNGKNIKEYNRRDYYRHFTAVFQQFSLYKNAPVIVLDEPTAALDPIAENDIYRRYHELTGNRTSIYISHRLASTRFCDRILLLENSEIAEEGTHDELLRKGGRYAELFEIQSRYYREGRCELEKEIG